MNYTIYSIPFKVNGLEYLKLLHTYTSGTDTDGSTFTIKNFSWSIALLPFENSKEKKIIHIHWETNIYGSKYATVSLVRMVYRFFLLYVLKVRGVKVVWTIHNLHAHDYVHTTIDAVGRWLMWLFVDVVIIQEKLYAESQMRIHPNKKIICIPQGNYVGVYGPLWSGDRESLRAEYGVKKGEIVLLSLGSIRPYKALPELIEAVRMAHKKGSPVRLIIAGKVTKEYEEEIRSCIGDCNAIILRPGFVADEKIPEILAMADYTIFYYGDSSLSSAAMILSVSYGVPVITRNIPASAMVVPGVSGCVFKTADELKEILVNLPTSRKNDSSVIIKTIEDQDWSTVTKKLRLIYKELWV